MEGPNGLSTRRPTPPISAGTRKTASFSEALRERCYPREKAVEVERCSRVRDLDSPPKPSPNSTRIAEVGDGESLVRRRCTVYLGRMTMKEREGEGWAGSFPPESD